MLIKIKGKLDVNEEITRLKFEETGSSVKFKVIFIIF